MKNIIKEEICATIKTVLMDARAFGLRVFMEGRCADPGFGRGSNQNLKTENQL